MEDPPQSYYSKFQNNDREKFGKLPEKKTSQRLPKEKRSNFSPVALESSVDCYLRVKVALRSVERKMCQNALLVHPFSGNC